MYQEIKEFQENQLKKKLPDLRAGDIVEVHQKIQEKDKERIQMFKGLVIAIKGNGPLSKRITVRRIASGVGVERIFPLNSPLIKKIKVIKRTKVKRAKLYYIREKSGRAAKLETKEGDLPEEVVEMADGGDQTAEGDDKENDAKQKKEEKGDEKTKVKVKTKEDPSPSTTLGVGMTDKKPEVKNESKDEAKTKSEDKEKRSGK